jgi:hypothetical protein
MHDTIERVDAYLNSKHISGDKDSLGRDKPFFNIVSAATNIWYRATDLDRKDIRFVPKDNASVPLAFVANVMLQNWMDENRFGQFLNAWGRALARYGSAVVKFVEQDGTLKASVVPWNRFIADPVQFDALPRIEKFYLTPAQLRKNPMYDQDIVDKLIAAKAARKTMNDQEKDTQDEFIELYEVHGDLDTRLLEDNPNLTMEDKDIKYRQQMHVVSYVADEKGAYDDFTLYRGKEAKDPYMITHLIEEDGRTLSIGAVEYLFDAQWMVNHGQKNIKDTLDLASKLIFQTSDTKFMGRNVLSAIETGEILVHSPDRPLTRLANDNPNITAAQNLITVWQSLAQEITSTPDALRGNTLPSGTPYSLAAYSGGQANSLFEIMTENKGLHIEDMLREYIVPHLKKRLRSKDEVMGILDDAGIQEIDAMYIPREAASRYNKQVKRDLIEGKIPTPYDPGMAQAEVQREMSALGNKRSFKPDELDEKQWEEMFYDFDWDCIRAEVTNENNDKQATLQTLASLYTSLAGTDPVKANVVLGRILTETGVFSPMQLGSVSTPTPMVAPGGGGAEAINQITPQG